MSQPPKTIPEAAQKWAKIYYDIAITAKSCQGVTAVKAGLDAARLKLISDLILAFSGKDPISVSTAWSTALTTFWLTPPQVFEGSTVGTVTIVGGTAVLQAGLLGIWASNVMNKSSQAEAEKRHKDLFKLFTQTIVVAHIFPSVCVGPLSF